MGTLQPPQDTHGQDTGQGPPERNRQVGRGGAGSPGEHVRWSFWPRPGNYSRIFTTPTKKIHGAARGYQEPFGAKHTGQDTSQS